MNKLPINFRDFLTVDYTQQAGTDIDPDGILAYQAQKRKKRLDETSAESLSVLEKAKKPIKKK